MPRLNATFKAERAARRKVEREHRKQARRQEKKRAQLFANRKVEGFGGVSLAEAIVIARLRKRGTLQDYTHEQIKDMALRMIGARLRSIGFLAAGWLQSIKTLAEKVGKPFRQERGLKAFNANAIGRMGTCIAARGFTLKPRCYIANHANAKNDHKQALIRYGQPALQMAVNQETRSTIEQVEKRLKASAKRQGIKVK